MPENAPEPARDLHESKAPEPARRPGWKPVVGAMALYLAALTVATFPAVTHLASNVPNFGDPVTHLWTMRWYKACLLEGRSPLRCPDIQYPEGAPLSAFPPMQLQTLLYIPLSLVFANDALCYNLIWIFGLLYTGMGTFALAWTVLRDRTAATFAGLLAMLSTPVMLHAHGHLELIHLGGVPMFLAAWMALVDRPSWRRLVLASALYLLVGLSAHYYVVMTVIPAALYVVGGLIRAGWRGAWPWARARLGWLAGFSVLTGVLLAVAFAVPLSTVAQGGSMARPRSQFLMFRTPLWSYATPTSLHTLAGVMPFDAYRQAGYADFLVESGAYLGIVTLVLLQYAAINRVRFPKAAYWWSALALMVVLSLGAIVQVGASKFDLPAYWIWKVFPPFRLLRVPARFNLYASVCAALVAAAGLKHLLGRMARPSARVATFAALCAVTVADMAMVPFLTRPMMPMPAFYTWARQQRPDAALLELPLLESNSGAHAAALGGYWQSIHGLRTTAGYSAHANARFDTMLVHNSPFDGFAMLRDGYLLDPDSASFGVTSSVNVLDYVWLSMTVNHLDYLVVHHEPELAPEQWKHLDRLQAQLAGARVYEDAAISAYDRARLRPPTRPVVMHADGWRSSGWPDRLAFTLPRSGQVVAYNPEAGSELTLALTARAFRESRTVILRREDGAELARWQVTPGDSRTYVSPPFRLPAGLHRLAIESDGEVAPTRRREAVAEGDMRPFSLHVAGMSLQTAPENVAATMRSAQQGGAR